jgi:hypothetical protein
VIYSRRNTLNYKKVVLVIAGALLTLPAPGCSGSLYKIRPVVELPPLTGAVKSGSAGGVTIRVAPLFSDEESQDLFEANLPLAGVLPLRLELERESGVPVELKRVRFRMRDAQGKEWKLLSTKQAIARILKANGVFLYNPNSRKQFEQDFKAYGLDIKTPLSSNEGRRQGFLFFQTPNGEAVGGPQGLTLTGERLPQPIEIALN